MYIAYMTLCIVRAMSRFKNLDKKGGSGDETSTTLKTQHQNTITYVPASHTSNMGDWHMDSPQLSIMIIYNSTWSITSDL